MDELVAAAIQEIATEGFPGCRLPTLWTLLQSASHLASLPLDSFVKKKLWDHLRQRTDLEISLDQHIDGSFPTPKPSLLSRDDSRKVEDADDKDVGAGVRRRPEAPNGGSGTPKEVGVTYVLPSDHQMIQEVADAETLHGTGVWLRASTRAQECALGLYGTWTGDLALSALMLDTLKLLAKAR